MFFPELLYFAIFSLVMLVPFGFCLLYIFISFRQWTIGEKENNAFKRKGALISLSISFGALIAIILVWYYVLTNL
jgi:hypothetical protein